MRSEGRGENPINSVHKNLSRPWEERERREGRGEEGESENEETKKMREHKQKESDETWREVIKRGGINEGTEMKVKI